MAVKNMKNDIKNINNDNINIIKKKNLKIKIKKL